MKVTSEQFKDLCCAANRLPNIMNRNAKVSFQGHTWVGENGKDHFKDYDFKEIKSLEVIFADDDSHDCDELIIKIK